MRLTSFAVAFFTAASAMGQGVDQQSQKEKTAAEVFKNVQVLKDVPENKWYDTMAFFAASLGVTCDKCHTAEFAKDDGNQSKLTARKMIRMVSEINQKNFGGQVVVTCNTCHRGTLKPQAAPVPDMEHWMETAEVNAPFPPATELIARYRRVVMDGSTKMPVTQSASLENETYSGKGPARRSRVAVLIGAGDKIRMTEQDNKSSITFVKNGQKGWIHDSKGWRTMDEDEADTLNTRAGNLSPDLVGALASPKTIRKDRVYEQPAYVVQAESKDGKKWFYFDVVSGLLVRQRTFFKSIYADGAMDMEYADYRKVGGLLLPFTIRSINAGGEGLTIRRIVLRKVNVGLKESDFLQGGG